MFIAGDLHDFHCHTPSVDILFKHARLLPRSDRWLLLNGDINDYPEFMDHNKKLRTNANNVDMIEEFYIPAAIQGADWTNSLLDKALKVFDADKIIVVQGNHEARLDYFSDMVPKRYRPEFDWKRLLRLRERGIRYVPYNHWVDFGNVSITHGMYHGTTALKRHYEAAGRSVIFNHVHQEGAQSFARRGDSIMAWSNPCMCGMAPAYLKGRENNWSIGYGLLHMRHDGRFNYRIHTIWDDKLVLDSGKVIEGEVLSL